MAVAVHYSCNYTACYAPLQGAVVADPEDQQVQASE